MIKIYGQIMNLLILEESYFEVQINILKNRDRRRIFDYIVDIYDIKEIRIFGSCR